MAEKFLGTVREVAEKVVKANYHYFSLSLLLKTVPEYILAMEPNNENHYQIAHLLDKLYFGRVGYLAGIRGFSLSEVFLLQGDLHDKLIDRPSHKDLPFEQQELVREIKFLKSLAKAVAYL